MKNPILLLSLALVPMFKVSAQEATAEAGTPKNTGEYYLRAGIGLAFPGGGQTSLNNGKSTFNTYESSNTFSVTPASYSAGTSAIIGAGYMFNKHIGIELTATYGIGRNELYYEERHGYRDAYSKWTETEIYEVTSYAQSTVLATPSVVIQSGGKLNIYARGGIVLPLTIKLISEEYYYDVNSSFAIRGTMEHTTVFKPGMSGAFGISYKPGKVVRYWMECNMLSIAPYLKHGRLTKYTENGYDRLSKLSTYESEIDYRLSGVINDVPKTDEPRVEHARAIPFNNIGVQAGLLFDF